MAAAGFSIPGRLGSRAFRRRTGIPLVFLICLLGLVALTLGCSSKPKHSAAAKTLKGADEQIFLGDTIEKNYDPNVIMKRAESFFEREEFHEAVIEYQHFLDLHRVHVLAPYAQFRMAEAHLRMFTSVDRDPDPVLKALAALEKLQRQYPESKYTVQAEASIRECNEHLAQHALLIGQFYYRREAYLAAAHRFEDVMKDYPDLPVAADALYYLALTYNELGAEDWAREKLILLAERYPNSEHKKDGQKLLASLNKKLPPQQAVAKAPSGSGELPSVALTQSIVALPKGPVPPSANAFTSSRPQAVSGNQTLCRIGVWC